VRGYVVEQRVVDKLVGIAVGIGPGLHGLHAALQPWGNVGGAVGLDDYGAHSVADSGKLNGYLGGTPSGGGDRDEDKRSRVPLHALVCIVRAVSLGERCCSRT